MESSHHDSVNTFNTQRAYPLMMNPLPLPAIKEERLPFTVKIAQTDADLEKAVQIRQAAYARHVPEIAAMLKEPEAFDLNSGSVILLAESKLDGSALGSMRIQTNRYEKLKLESSVNLPNWLQDQVLAEAARLGVVGNRMGRIVKVLLFKAFYLYCINKGIDWMVITARSPVDRDYEGLLFKDVFPGQGYIPMVHDAGIPHRVMVLNVPSVEPSWNENHHVLYDLFFKTHHPDLDLSEKPIEAFNHPMTKMPISEYRVVM